MLLQKRSDLEIWSFLGGGQNVGESITDALRREVREESGLMIEPKRLIGIYASPEFDIVFPNGDEVQYFSAFFECEVIEGELRADGDETLELGWFDLDNLPPMTKVSAQRAKDLENFRGETFFR